MGEKGYQVIAKVNLPPEAQYASGHSLIVQGDTPEEVAILLGAAVGGSQDQGALILQRFGEYALGKAAEAALRPTPAASTPTAAPAPAAGGAPEPASDAFLKVVAAKTGKTFDELKGLSKAEAQELLKKEGK